MYYNDTQYKQFHQFFRDYGHFSFGGESGNYSNGTVWFLAFDRYGKEYFNITIDTDGNIGSSPNYGKNPCIPF